MKQFSAFLLKEFRHMGRDWRTLLILVAMPVVMVLLFGYAITTEVTQTRTAVLDPTHDYLTRRITDRIAANPFFELTATCASAQEVDALFREGRIDLAVVFASELASAKAADASAVVQLLIDGSEPNQAAVRQGYAMQVIQEELLAASAANGEPVTDVSAQIPLINVSTRMLYNPQGKSAYNFVPAVIGMILLLLCTLMSSISIVREKENGTMEVLLASPLPPAVIIAAKLVPYFVVGMVNLLSILFLAHFVIGVPVEGSLVAFLALSVLYIGVALALGLLISTLVSTQLAAMLLSMLMIVPTMYLSGLVFQLDAMPLPAQAVSTIIPARWFMDGARRLMIQGVEVRHLFANFMVLGAELLVLFGLSVLLFKKRLE